MSYFDDEEDVDYNALIAAADAAEKQKYDENKCKNEKQKSNVFLVSGIMPLVDIYYFKII